MRKATMYFLIGANLLLAGALVILILVVLGLRSDVKQSAVSANMACKRGNVQRQAVKFLLEGRVHDSELVGSSAANSDIAEYFEGQVAGARKQLEALVAATKASVPEGDPLYVDCDQQYPLP